MTDKKGKAPPDTNPSIGTEEPELVSDEDIVALDTGEERFDPAEEEPTGKLVVPPEFNSEQYEEEDFAGQAEDGEFGTAPEEHFSRDDTGPLLLDDSDFVETGEEEALTEDGEPGERRGTDSVEFGHAVQNEPLMWSQQTEAQAELVEEGLEDTGEVPAFAEEQEPHGEPEEEQDLDATAAEPLAGRKRRRRSKRGERPLEQTVPGITGNSVNAPWEEFEQRKSPDELTLPDDGTQRVDLGAVDENGAPQASLQEETVILGQEDAGSPSLPVLVVVQGEDEGREIEIVAEYTSIGRGADNDLVFPDIACSRKHAVIYREGDVYVIKDLGSGNGTMVNGRKVQEAVLNDGDEIRMGNTVLQFLWPEASVQQRPALSTTASASAPVHGRGIASWFERTLPDPRTRKLVAFGGGGVVALLLVLVVVKIASSGGGEQHRQPTKEQLQARLQEQFQQHFEAAKRYIKEKDYQNAFLEIQLGLKIRPDSTLLKQYREHVELEMKSSSNIKQANIALAQDDLENAVKFAGQVPPESEYYQQARKIIEESRKRRMDKLAEQGRQLMEQGEYAQAILKFDEVLAQDPTHQKASLWKEEASRKLREEEAKALRLATRRKRHGGSYRGKTRSSRKKREGGKALAHYLAGKLDEAIMEAETSGFSKTARDLRAFSKLYDECSVLVKNKGMFEKAIAKLQKAEKLDRKISGGRGVFHERIRKWLSTTYYLAGIDAKFGNRLPQSYRYFKQAKRYGNDKADKMLKELEKTGKRLFQNAYVMHNDRPEKAQQLLKTALQIIPPDNPYYKKSKKLLRKITGEGSSGDTAEEEDF